KHWLPRQGGASAPRLCPRVGPGFGVPQEIGHRLVLAGGEAAEPLGGGSDVPPGGERMQGDALGGEARLGMREDAVIEDDEGMLDLAAGLADGADEIELGGALAGEVLDQEDARTLGEPALDLGVAAEPLGLLSDVEHRQRQPVGDPGGERYPGGLAAGDRI